MLKGWFDRVVVSGVAWELPPGADRIRPMWRNLRRIVTVTTHGSGKFTNMVEGEAGKRIMTRSLRVLAPRRCRTHWIALYDTDRSTAEQRERFLARVERRIGRLAGGR
jgi:putative NADPH-quinone reductase